VRRLTASFAATLAFLAAAAASAQTITGTITGRVVDSQGLSVPGVTITVASPALQGLQTAVSSENGDYIVPPPFRPGLTRSPSS
jgi:hypothetical protein